MKNYLSEIEVFHDRSIGHANPFHQHETYELYLLLTGNITFFTEEKGYELHQGDLVLIPPNRWHRAQTNDNKIYERAYVNITPNMLSEFSSPDSDLSKGFPQPKGEITILHLDSDFRKKIIDKIDKILQLTTSGEFGADIKANVLIIEILLMINEPNLKKKETNQTSLPSLIIDLLAYINRHLDGDLSMNILSQELHLNSSHISRSFKRFMGISIQDYIIRKRMSVAKECLLNGASVQDAANQSGYGNYAHFIRAFKGYFGITPGKYSRQKL